MAVLERCAHCPSRSMKILGATNHILIGLKAQSTRGNPFLALHRDQKPRYIIGPMKEPTTSSKNEYFIKLTPNDILIYVYHIIIPIYYCIFQPLLEKVLSAVDNDEHRDPQLVKVQRKTDFRMLSPEQDIYITPPSLQVPGSL